MAERSFSGRRSRWDVVRWRGLQRRLRHKVVFQPLLLSLQFRESGLQTLNLQIEGGQVASLGPMFEVTATQSMEDGDQNRDRGIENRRDSQQVKVSFAIDTIPDHHSD